MKEIDLGNEKFVLVDDGDYEYLSNYNWNFDGRYVKRTVRNEGKYKTILMHSCIMNTPKGMVIDHINGNVFDNRKSNLRICSQKENLWNRKGSYRNPSGYKGVTWNAQRNKWRVRVGQKYFGSFSCKKDAAKKYNEEAIKIYGEYAFLNEIR